MRYPAVAFVSAILVSAVALGQSRVLSDVPDDQEEPYFLVEPIIKTILENLRPILANLKIGDVEETIVNPFVNGTINIRNIMVKGADRFVIAALKSNLFPLKVTNLTLKWDEIAVTAGYDIDTYLAIPQLKSPIRLYAKGDASFKINGVFFTIGANVDVKNNMIQIKPNGLFGFDLDVKEAKVSLSSVMGSSELGTGLGVFLSEAIPEIVRLLKQPLFNVFEEDIIRIINEFLKGDKMPLLLDDVQDLQELPSYNAAGELDSFFGHSLDVGADLEEAANNEFNFNF